MNSNNNLGWSHKDVPDLTGKLILVTGGNSGLGFESVKTFASRGARVILSGRSLERAENACSEILRLCPGASVEAAQLDLANLMSVRQFASRFIDKYSRLDVLLNNAGIMTTPYFQTIDGIEGQMGTNHFGHFALTGLLMPVIKRTKKSRVVNVSSIAHKAGKIDFNNPLFENGNGYSPIKAYGRSKLANLLFTYELQRYFEKTGTDSISAAAHPGVSATQLFRHLDTKFYFRIIRPLMKQITQDGSIGALPQIRAATDPDVKGQDFFGPSGFMELKGYPVKVKSNTRSLNPELARKLWKLSEDITGVSFS